MKSIIFLSLIALTILHFVVVIHSKKVKSSDEDKSEEVRTKDDSDEDLKAKHSKEKKDITTRNLTFLITGRKLAKSKVQVNPYVSMFYESKASDLNAFSSEVIAGSNDPNWAQVFSFVWKKGSEQKIRFKVKSQVRRQSDQLLGEATLNVDEYVENEEKIELRLGNGSSKNGFIEIAKTIPISFRLSARGLARKDTFHTKSDPYVKCYWRHGPDGTDVKFAKTSIINNVEDADWADIITYEAYQPGKDQYWSFKVYDDDGFTKDDFLGEAFVKIDSFVENEAVKTKTVDLSLKGTLTIRLI